MIYRSPQKISSAVEFPEWFLSITNKHAPVTPPIKPAIFFPFNGSVPIHAATTVMKIGVTKVSNAAWILKVSETPFTNKIWLMTTPVKLHAINLGISFFFMDADCFEKIHSTHSNITVMVTRMRFNPSGLILFLVIYWATLKFTPNKTLADNTARCAFHCFNLCGLRRKSKPWFLCSSCFYNFL